MERSRRRWALALTAAAVALGSLGGLTGCHPPRPRAPATSTTSHAPEEPEDPVTTRAPRRAPRTGAAARPAALLPPTRVRLDNGLTLVLQENHASRVVAFQAWVEVGSADEPPELAGIAHVFEHMLFKGTARRGVGRIAQEVEAAGGEINAWTSFDQTVYHLVLASRFFDTGLDILADALQHSSFDAKELERELKVVLEEVKQGEDSPARVAAQSLFSTAYQKHPYRRPVIGTVKTVKTFTRDKLVDFFQSHYVADKMTLVVVGDFDTAQAKEKIARAFAQAPRGDGRPWPRAEEPAQKAARVSALTRDVREAQLAIAFHIPGVRHEDAAALDLAALVLGQGDASRLSMSVKRERQLVSDAYAYAYTPRDPGLLVVGATLPPGDIDRAFPALVEEAARLAVEELRPDELERARAILESDAIYQKETVEGQARKLGFFETVAGGLDAEERYMRAVRTATPASVRETVARYLVPENATISAMMPNGTDTRALEARLKTKLTEAVARAQSRFAPVETEAGDVVRVKLPGGPRVLVMRDGSVGLVAVRAVWKGGLLLEDERTSGLSHLTAQTLVRGTATRPGVEILHEIERLAGSLGAFAGRNSIGLRLELLSRDWERGLTLLSDCMLHPAFAEEELERERRQMLEEIRTREDHVSSEAFRLFARTLFPRHPYRLDLLGTAESVPGLTRKRVVDYWKRNLSPNDVTISVVGDVDPKLVVARLRALFAGAAVGDEPPRAAPARAAAPANPREPAKGPVEVIRYLNRQQAHIVYGFPGLKLDDKDRYALEVLSTILSGQGGRLFLELRDKRGLAYRVSAVNVEGLDPGYFAVYMATSPENLEVAIAGIKDELARVLAAPVPAEELERAKRYLVGAHEISLQRKSALASTLAFHEAYGLGWKEHRVYADRILAVSAADLQAVARRILDPQRAVLAVVRPDPHPPVLAKAPGEKLTPSLKRPRGRGKSKSANSGGKKGR